MDETLKKALEEVFPYIEKGNYKAAVDHLSLHSFFKPLNADQCVEKALELLSTQEKEKLTWAAVLLHIALKRRPHHFKALYNLGVVMTERGNIPHALKSLKAALQLNPTDCDTWIALGNVYSDKSEYKEAEKAYLKALELNPKSARAHRNLALSLIRAADVFRAHKKSEDYIKQALSEANQAIHLDPSDPDNYFMLAWARGHAGDIGGFFDAQRHAVSMNWDLSGRALDDAKRLVRILFSAKNFEAVGQLLDKLDGRCEDPDDPETVYNIAKRTVLKTGKVVYEIQREDSKGNWVLADSQTGELN